MEICIDQIANMRVEQMNLVLEATRQTVMSKYAPGEDDLYMQMCIRDSPRIGEWLPARHHCIHDLVDIVKLPPLRLVIGVAQCLSLIHI